VADYPFSEGTGSTTADASGNGNTGIVSGATWTTGRFGKALVFDGFSGFVSVPGAPALNLGAAVTLEAWIFPTALGGSRVIVGRTKTGVASTYFMAARGTEVCIPARVGIGTKRLTEVLVGMETDADYILIDSSPILLVPDNLYMASAADGILLVVDSGSTRPRDLLRTKEILERAGTPIVGVVLNRTPLRQTNYYYKHYMSYYKS